MHTARELVTTLSAAEGRTILIPRRHPGIQYIYPDTFLEESARGWIATGLVSGQFQEGVSSLYRGEENDRPSGSWLIAWIRSGLLDIRTGR
mgnify:CR=1 FL=1